MFTIRFWDLDFQMIPNLWSKKRTMVDSTIVPGRPRHVGWRRCHTAALWCLIKWLAMDGMMIACDQIFSWKTQTWQTRERATVQQGTELESAGIGQLPYLIFLYHQRYLEIQSFHPQSHGCGWTWNMTWNATRISIWEKTRWSTLNLGLASISDQAISLLLVLTCPIKSY